MNTSPPAPTASPNELELVRHILPAMSGQQIDTLAHEAGVNRTTVYRLRRHLPGTTSYETVHRLYQALGEPHV